METKVKMGVNVESMCEGRTGVGIIVRIKRRVKSRSESIATEQHIYKKVRFELKRGAMKTRALVVTYKYK